MSPDTDTELRSGARTIHKRALVRSFVPNALWHAAQLPLLGLTMLSPRRAPIEPLPDDGHRRALLFVHGLGGHRGNFLPMQAWLRFAAGRRRTYSWGLTPGRSIEALAAELPAFLDEVARANGLGDDAQFDLVAHSMGGLVARCALEDPAVARRVATLVTLGTPHGGSVAARYVPTEIHRALRPESPLMTRLTSQAPWAHPTRLVCFWSQSDLLLHPATTARVEGAENHELDGITHYGYLLRPECWRRVHDVLTFR
jgi:pimeloyl-ACP methyl ester carboxylesterase